MARNTILLRARLSVFAALTILTVAAARASGPVLLYSPDAAVDRDPVVGYFEPSIATDPRDPKTLVAAAMAVRLSTVEAYVSHNGGYDWRLSPLPVGGDSLEGDVQVAAHPSGALYFTALGPAIDRNGKQKFGLHVLVSNDHGDSFHRVAVLQYNGHSYDHEQLTIDNSHSRYRGNIYMSVLYSIRITPQENACGVLRSSDGGRRFSGPVTVVTGWCFNSRPQYLPDGTVIFPYFLSPGLGKSVATVNVAISKDGGRTFGAPHPLGTYVSLTETQYYARMAAGQTDFDGDPVPQFAAGTVPHAHGGVIYGIWSDLRTGVEHLLLTKSVDGGAHWSVPTPVLETQDPSDAQYQASIAVNEQGVLAVAYLQCLHAAGTVTEMFAHSEDGGASFAAPVALQSTPSTLTSARDSGYSGFAEYFQNHVFAGFVQPEKRFPSGGDYVAMAVDRGGAFHPIWADARTGTYQVWTASAMLGGASSIPTNLVSTEVSKDVDLQFGLGSWDAATQTLSIPVRLHNASSRAIYPQLTVTVLDLHNPLMPASERTQPGPSFLNADNGQNGLGAAYTYDASTVGNLGVLAPGADTAPKIWKLRLTGSDSQPSIVVRVDGYVTR